MPFRTQERESEFCGCERGTGIIAVAVFPLVCDDVARWNFIFPRITSQIIETFGKDNATPEI